MATFTRLKSGHWRVQVRRKQSYASETFLRHEDARKWAIATERRVDLGQSPLKRTRVDPTTLAHLVDLQRVVLLHDRKDPREKDGNDQLVPLLDLSGFDALELIKDQRKHWLRGDLVFPYNSRSVGTAFRRACRTLKIKNLHFHDLRHEATSRLFEAGLRIEEVALVTGHRDWKMLKRYTHLRPEHLARTHGATSNITALLAQSTAGATHLPVRGLLAHWLQQIERASGAEAEQYLGGLVGALFQGMGNRRPSLPAPAEAANRGA